MFAAPVHPQIRRVLFAVVSGILFLVSTSTPAETLTQRQIYERCFAKLVRQTPGPDDPFVNQINAGTLTGSNACIALLNLASFNGTTSSVQTFTNEPAKYLLAQKVLASMHDFHMSWFTVKRYVSGGLCEDQMTNGLVDNQTPALYLTRALFHPDKSKYTYASVVTGSDTPKALRVNQNPDRSIYGPNKTTSSDDTSVPNFDSYVKPFEFAGHGPLLGVGSWSSPLTILSVTAAPNIAGEDFQTQTNFNGRVSQGGGLLGSQAFLLNTFGENADILTDLEKMPRTFSKSVFRDLLCRELPVLNDGDADRYLSEASDAISFRKSTACLQCHASMDQLLGVVRNQRLMRSGPCATARTPDIYNSHHLFGQPWTTTNTSWPPTKNLAWRKNKPTGKLLFRDYKNALQNYDITGLGSLGNTLALSDDLYVCAAKRYYEYFTGIDVDISPIGSGTLSPDQAFYRQRVVNLGIEFKNTLGKDPKKLVEKILNLPEYKCRDFQLRGQSSGSQEKCQ